MSSRRRPRRHADETVYGLAADATYDAAVAAIYAAKERPAINPLISHVVDIDAAREHAIFGPEAETLARAFWPGPLTLVLPVASICRISLLARAGTRHRGVSLAVARNRAGSDQGGGNPPGGGSANRSGAVSPTTAAHVAADLDGRVDWIIDGGPCRHGLESTIVACLAATPIAAAGRDNPGSDQVRTRFADRLAERRGGRSERARAIGVALCAQDRASNSAQTSAADDEAALDFAARSRAGGHARGSIFRRPQTLSRPRPICFPTCARSTAPARRGSRSRRSRAWARGGDQRSAPPCCRSERPK